MARVGALGLAALLLLCRESAAFQFDVLASQYKCFTEEYQGNTQIQGSFHALPGYSQYIDVRISTTEGDVIQEWSRQDKADINFMSGNGGEFTFCFYNRLLPGVKNTGNTQHKRRIEFTLHSGADAIDYDRVARREHLKPVELNLRMMEDSVKEIHNDYTYFKAREADMRDTNEAINAKAMWVTIINICFVIACASYQVLHLKRFFISKKLING